jgi:hypothetical protein
MSVGFDWELSYYPELFEWMILPQDFDASKWYTLHDNSGEWYYIEGEVNVALGSRALDLVPISDDIDVYEVRRVDNTVGATVSLQKGLGIMGSVELEGSLSRTWSSLPPNAPVDIPEWSGGVRLSWEKKLGIR